MFSKGFSKYSTIAFVSIFDKIESSLEYNQWYCGHYHTDKKINNLQFMFKDICVFINK